MTDNVQDFPGQAGQVSRTGLPIGEAAKRLGMNPDTLRKRLQRGQENGYKANDGRWRVYVPADQDTSGNVPEIPGSDQDIVQDKLIEQLEIRLTEKDEQIAFLKEQIATKDRAVANLIEKIAPPESGGQMQSVMAQLRVSQAQHQRDREAMLQTKEALEKRLGKKT